jgi:GH25 family lysozyme M1 (1,4-beta-N-acetylmuramidase)
MAIAQALKAMDTKPHTTFTHKVVSNLDIEGVDIRRGTPLGYASTTLG